ncbi:hypothetical protein F4805DRAFT_462245 [Annulohypoxylon moriforme]|nr:hypothetical protein F4805DRAFT_462245 [Annulohypoxylon moriforme]
MSCLTNIGRPICETCNVAQKIIYSAASDINFRNSENPKWWFYNDNAEDFLTSPSSAISAVEDKQAFIRGCNIAIDSIRFLRDEIKKYRSLTWQDVRDTRPVFFIASDLGHRRGRYLSYSGPLKVEISPQKAILQSMTTQLFQELRSLIPRNWQPWFTRFDTLSISDQLDVLESLPRPLPPMVSPVDQRLCIVVGLDDVYNREMHNYVKRFLRIIEQLFIADGRGKILLMFRTPFDLAGMLEVKSCVINLKKR